jgi:hypothetical protein
VTDRADFCSLLDSRIEPLKHQIHAIGEASKAGLDLHTEQLKQLPGIADSLSQMSGNIETITDIVIKSAGELGGVRERAEIAHQAATDTTVGKALHWLQRFANSRAGLIIIAGLIAFVLVAQVLNHEHLTDLMPALHLTAK